MSNYLETPEKLPPANLLMGYVQSLPTEALTKWLPDNPHVRKLTIWATSVLITGILAAMLLPNGEMAVALTALVTAIAGTILFGEERMPLVIVALMMLPLGGLGDFHGIIENMEWVLFIKLVALLTWVDFLNHTKYFDHLIERYLPRKLHGFPLIALLCVLAACSAALIDEVNSIVLWYFVTRAIIGFTPKGNLKLKAASWTAIVILLVSATNIGSQFLPLGNPVGIAISVISGLTAVDFITYAWLPGMLTLAYFTVRVRYKFPNLIGEFKSVTVETADFEILEDHVDQFEVIEYEETATGKDVHPVEHQAVPIPLLHGLFSIGVIGLVMATPISNLLNSSPETGLGIFVLALFATTLFIGSSYGRHTELVLRELPWNTLFFIVFLFGIAHGLETSGLTESAAEQIYTTFGTNEVAVRIVIVLVAALVTAFMDNVIAIAIIAPIIIALGDRGFETQGLWFSLLSAAVVAGNLTPIGSTANIIANAKVKSSWGTWWKTGGMLAVECLIVNQVLLYLWEQVIR
ncbi:MAG: anion permease [Chloroflexi bacterium]|nr:anion permease [Chloroflexota bacterium]